MNELVQYIHSVYGDRYWSVLFVLYIAFSSIYAGIFSGIYGGLRYRFDTSDHERLQCTCSGGGILIRLYGKQSRLGSERQQFFHSYDAVLALISDTISKLPLFEALTQVLNEEYDTELCGVFVR